MQEDRELWIEFIKRDVPQWDRFKLPETCDCWYDVYRDLVEQVQREVDEDAARLKLAVDQINSKRASSGSKFLVDRQVARLPKPRPTRVQRYAAHDRKMGGISPTFSVSYNADGEKVWSLEQPPRLRPERSRSEPKKSSIFTAKRNKALAVPTHRLKSEVSQIKQVPRWLVDEHKQSSPTQAPRRPVAASSQALSAVPFASSASSASSASFSESVKASPVSPPSSSALQAREDRLRALTSKHTTTSSSSAPSSASFSTSPSSTAQSSSAPSSTASPRAKPAETRPAQTPKRPAGPLLSETKNTQPSPDRKSESSTRPSAPAQSAVDSTAKSSSPPGASTSRPPPAPALIRKRPAPSVFIQPKRKKA